MLLQSAILGEHGRARTPKALAGLLMREQLDEPSPLEQMCARALGLREELLWKDAALVEHVKATCKAEGSAEFVHARKSAVQLVRDALPHGAATRPKALAHHVPLADEAARVVLAAAIGGGQGGGTYEVVPIDHAFCLPTFGFFREAEFAWRYWVSSRLPFDQECREYVASLDADDDVQTAREVEFYVRFKALLDKEYGLFTLR